MTPFRLWSFKGRVLGAGVWVCPSAGVATFSNGRRKLTIRAPWDKPFFSERNGYWPHKRFMGWRWGWTKLNKWGVAE